MNARIKKRSLLVLLAALALCISGLFAIGFGDRAKAETAAAENFYMENGAYVRYSSVTPGIRFVSHITESYYNELVGKAAEDTLKFYTVIENVSNPSSTPSRIEHTQPVEFDGDRLMSLKAALAFRLEDRELTAEEIKLVSAIECKATVFAEYRDKTSGETVTVQASGDGVIRSMRGVANYALEQSLSEEQQELLKGYLGTRSTDDVQKTVYLADESAVEMFGLTGGAVYIGARKIGDITDGVIDLSAETLATDVATTVYVFDGDNNCTAYSCVFVNPVLLSDNPVVALNRDSETSYDFNLNGGETVTGVKIGGVALESSAYSQSGSVLTISKSAFGASGEKKVVITTAGATYLANATVADYAIGTLAEFKVFWSRTGFPVGATVSNYVVFTADIDASTYSFHGGNVISTCTFDGVIDGRGHTVSGAHSTYYGMFHCLGTNAVIKNIAFTGIRFYRDSSIVSDIFEGRMENCYFEGGGGTAANNALAYRLGNTAVIENVVVYLHDRPSETEEKAGVFNGLTNGGTGATVAPKGVYVINTSSNGKICTTAGSTDTSDIWLYNSLEDFKAKVTALPDGFSTAYWHIGENGLTFGKTTVNLAKEIIVANNRTSETEYTLTLNDDGAVKSVTVGGVVLESSAYTQSSNVLTISKSAFGASGEKVVTVETAELDYLATATVADYAIGDKTEFLSFWNKTVLAAGTTVSSYVVLTDNITVNSTANVGIANYTFNGVFDGRGYTIIGAPAGYMGLFYDLGANGVIKNVAFTGTGFQVYQAIFGNKLEGRVENCYFEGYGVRTDGNAVPAFANQIGANAVIKNVVVYSHDIYPDSSTKNGVFNNTMSSATMTTAPSGLYVVNTSSNKNICTTAGSTDLSGIHLYSTIDAFKAEVKALPDGFSSDYWMVDGNGGLVFKSSQVSLMTATLHKSNVAENAARTFVSGSKSDYVIIKDNDGAKMTAAVKFILDNVYKATGVTLKTETYSSGRENGWTSNDKLIVFDNDAFFNKAGLTMPDENLGQGGYYIKTVGNTVFIACAHEDGYQLGAIKFLNETLGYDMLSADCVVYEKSGSTIPDMDITERPDYEYRMVSTFKMPTAVYGMGFNASKFTEMFMSVPDRATGENPLTMHNSFNYLPPSMYNNSADSENYHPKWYSYPDDAAKRQLCYTAHGDETEYNAMVETLYIYLKQIVDANPDMCNITVTQQDNHAYCDCAACKAVVEKYGAISAAYIMFLNDVDDKLQAALESEAAASGTAKREVNVIFFAYHGTKESPTTLGSDGKYKPASADVIMNEHVGVMVAPIESYYTSSFYSQVNIENGETENVKSWSCLTDKIYMWLYDTYFNNYFYPYNTWETIINNYMFCYANNAVYMFNQGQHDQASPSAFTAFKYYIDSKAGVNFNVSYEKLEEKFFRCYFKDAAEPMYAFFTNLKERLSYLEETYAAVDGGINNGSATNALANAEYWPIDVLNEYLGYIDSALASVAKYETTDSATYTMLKNHILAESLFPRYALITLYESSFTSEELTEKRTAFKTDCDALGVTRYGEFASRDLSILYESWGIAD